VGSCLYTQLNVTPTRSPVRNTRYTDSKIIMKAIEWIGGGRRIFCNVEADCTVEANGSKVKKINV